MRLTLERFSQSFYRCVGISLLFSLISCAQVSDQQSRKQLSSQAIIPVNKALFSTEGLQVLPIEEVYALTEDQRKTFIDFYNMQLVKGVKPHRALYLFLQDRIENFTYFGETFIAEKVMRLNKGNCMSLAIFTTALAKVAGLEVSYREVNTLPIFEKHSNLLLSSTHVQTIIFDPTFVPEQDMYYMERPGIVIDYFPNSTNRVSKKVSIKEFGSMFYNNIAASALIDSKINKAFLYAEQAYTMAPQSKEVVNLLAVLHRRSGDEFTAEKYYQLALKQIDDDITLLSNYAVLLMKTNRVSEAEKIIAQLEKLDDPNPYNWLEQAYLAHGKNKRSRAALYYQKVIDRAPYVHQAYLGLYKIYLANNEKRKARDILKAGLKWAYDDKQRSIYKYKMFGENNT